MIGGAIGWMRDLKESQNKASIERERLVLELQYALKEVKTLKGLLPICTSCKNIRDNNGFWGKAEDFIKENSEARVSHCICPSCTEAVTVVSAKSTIHNIEVHST